MNRGVSSGSTRGQSIFSTKAFRYGAKWVTCGEWKFVSSIWQRLLLTIVNRIAQQHFGEQPKSCVTSWAYPCPTSIWNVIHGVLRQHVTNWVVLTSRQPGQRVVRCLSMKPSRMGWSYSKAETVS